ncbi:hypothetical protein ACFLKB_13110 [Clostridium sp. FAM 1755]|uniref:hypothetical protein n=1 Tax=Clostridium caseinilyticum TaxID=3350403 RepID=UPI0038F6304B
MKKLSWIIYINNKYSETLTKILSNEIEKFIIDLCKTQDNIKINHIGVYNNFQRKSNYHEDTINNIIKIIREYLMVDKRWKYNIYLN